MKIIIDNAVCSNGGDMAIARSIQKIFNGLYGEDVRYVIYDSNSETCQGLYPDVCFQPLLSALLFKRYECDWKSREKLFYILKLARVWLGLALIKYNLPFAECFFSSKECDAIREYKDADLVVSTGGTYLVENYDLRYRFLEYALCRFFGKKLVFFTQTMGPFKKDYNIKHMKTYLNYASLVFLRDQKSLDNISHLVDDQSKCHVIADSVFALFQPEKAQEFLSLKKKPLKTVAISVRHWPYFKSGNAKDGMKKYRDAIAKTVEWLVTEYNVRVEFFSTCQGLPTYNYDDSAVATEIYESLSKDLQQSVIVHTGFHSLEEIMAFAENMDLVIATRMHMAILSLCSGTPVIPIANEFKQVELSKRLGIEDLLLDINTITFEGARDVLRTYIEDLQATEGGNAPSIVRTMFENVEKEYRSALSAEEILKAAI